MIQNPSAYVGQKEVLDGAEYTIVDDSSIKSSTGAKCTTLVTDMISLFFGQSTFNEAIGDWDVNR
ncbi:MAG: hypothetical protein OXE77_08385 [Flavobacteriaceae bacterium]|nr:hypothetical protein [Flavobacteriaceae bacterium]MCY4267741.1 hypothetical protein [Flavobacteriaceae bacterium]